MFAYFITHAVLKHIFDSVRVYYSNILIDKLNILYNMLLIRYF